MADTFTGLRCARDKPWTFHAAAEWLLEYRSFALKMAVVGKAKL